MERAKLLESLLGSTVVAGVLSLLGTGVTSIIQDNSKRNEIALSEFRQNQVAQSKIVTDAFNLIGPYMASIDDLITLSDKYFDASAYSPADRPALEKFFSETQNRHDNSDIDWRAKKYATGYLVVYHHGGRRDVADKWATLVKTIDGFDDCATDWFKTHPRGTEDIRKARPCSTEKLAIETAMATMTGTLRAK